jgi:hypothetical protein
LIENEGTIEFNELFGTLSTTKMRISMKEAESLFSLAGLGDLGIEVKKRNRMNERI